MYFNVALCALRRMREAALDRSTEGILRYHGEKATVNAALYLMNRYGRGCGPAHGHATLIR